MEIVLTIPGKLQQNNKLKQCGKPWHHKKYIKLWITLKIRFYFFFYYDTLCVTEFFINIPWLQSNLWELVKFIGLFCMQSCIFILRKVPVLFQQCSLRDLPPFYFFTTIVCWLKLQLRTYLVTSKTKWIYRGHLITVLCWGCLMHGEMDCFLQDFFVVQ